MGRYTDPSTDTATFISGTHNGRLGARERQQKDGPPLSRSKQGLADARIYGLPERITGNPLGCQCHVAHLASAGPVINGEIEADYHCDFNYHNYVLFKVRQYAKEGERGIKIDKFGNLTESDGYQAGELGNM